VSADPIAVLLIEDHPGDARLVREALGDARMLRFTVTHATTLAAGVAALDAGGVDVVLLDLSLPDGAGLASIARLRAVAPTIPILVLTGTEDEDMALRAVRGGAQDYLVKGIDGGALARGIAHAVERHRMLLELESTRRDQLALKDRVLSHVSHELRAPLHAVGGFVALLVDGLAGEVTAAQREYLELAQHNLEQLGRMIRDLLDATRAETGKLLIEPAPLDLAEVVAATTRSLAAIAEAKRIALAVEVPDTLPAYADALRVEQVVMNLVDNAIKFTPEGGRVHVVAESDGTEVRVSVIDSGSGIAPDALPHVFERLYQAGGKMAARGLGLGLFICRALIERQGGRIWVEPSPGGGSIFRFTLPRESPRQAAAPARAAAHAPS
jgi:sigma-B regulation protein RsbU (phosphoserine phosphatase)